MAGILKHRCVFVFILVFFIMLTGPRTRAELGVNEILEKMFDAHKQYSEGMSVPYQREILSRSMALLDDMDLGDDRASGVFFFKAPHFLKIQQETPSVEFFISNGKNVWWYVPAEKTVYRLDSISEELTVLSTIFLGLKNPEDTFITAMTKPESSGLYNLMLTPKDAWEEVDHINVAVCESDFKMTLIEIFDISGNLTRFRLGEFRKEKDLKESFFDFEAPENVIVIEE